MRVVFDTTILVAAARSRLGASFALIAMLPLLSFQPVLSVALYCEWQDVLTRQENIPPGKTVDDVVGFLRYLASICLHQEIFFSWRPFLRDPNDDMILELAVAGGCDFIVTHNVRDFTGSSQMGVQAITPRDFLMLLRKQS